MTGFWALIRKELLEQRRTWRFLALAGTFIALALLVSFIPYAVLEIKDEPRGREEARNLLQGFAFAVFALGALLSIIVAMGSLAGERASGTAAMTLAKPVTRTAFVASKFLGLSLSIFAALAVGSLVMYLLTLALFANGGLGSFAAVIGVLGLYVVYVGSIAFFWSAMFRRQLLAGGLALFIWIAQAPLNEIPHTEGYWPASAPEWAMNRSGLEGNGEGGTARWESLPILLGCVAGFSTGAWAVFRRKEL